MTTGTLEHDNLYQLDVKWVVWADLVAQFFFDSSTVTDVGGPKEKISECRESRCVGGS